MYLGILNKYKNILKNELDRKEANFLILLPFSIEVQNFLGKFKIILIQGRRRMQK
jgi:hypothetical protein